MRGSGVGGVSGWLDSADTIADGLGDDVAHDVTITASMHKAVSAAQRESGKRAKGREFISVAGGGR